MKAALYFRLDDPEDIQAHMRCTKATDMALALYQLRNAIQLTQRLCHGFIILLTVLFK